MSIPSVVKNVLATHSVAIASVTRRYEAVFINGPDFQEGASRVETLENFKEVVVGALTTGGIRFTAVQAYIGHYPKHSFPCVNLTEVVGGIQEQGIEVQVQAPSPDLLDQMKKSFTRDIKKRSKKAPQVKNELVDEMAVDEGLAGDGEIEDIEAPRSDLEDL